MSQAIAIRTTLFTSFTLLFFNSIVYAQANVPVGIRIGVPKVVQKQLVPVIKSESIAAAPKMMPAKKKVDKSNQPTKQPSSAIQQARPGERVTNPAHAILNLDTTLGGVPINGTGPNDFGYMGPGDMRTHLWNSHAKELIANGITEYTLMAMAQTEVQKWHNHFHGVEGSPEHPHDDDHHGHLDASGQQPTMSSSATYVEDPVYGTIVIENSGYYNSGYPQTAYGQSEIIFEHGVIIQGATPHELETQMPSTIQNQAVIQSAPIDSQRSSRRVGRE